MGCRDLDRCGQARIVRARRHRERRMNGQVEWTGVLAHRQAAGKDLHLRGAGQCQRGRHGLRRRRDEQVAPTERRVDL